MTHARGLIIAAPASGSGKTVITVGLLAALRARGVDVAAAKSGPDFIDPGFHHAAADRPSMNLDPWAMRPATIASQLTVARDTDLILCEGAMGLFDGIDAAGTASTAALAAMLGWPVVLVVDVRGQGASVAALVEGFARHSGDVRVSGVILNRVGSAAHAELLRRALDHLPEVPVLGAVPRAAGLVLPERHLGLVPAGETTALSAFVAAARHAVEQAIDLDRLLTLAAPARLGASEPVDGIPPPGAHVAVARDDAFVFAYPALLESWRRAGAAISLFAPLADEAPPSGADAVFLPGGYPELHAGRLAAARRFLGGLRDCTGRDAVIYGECGGYMVLGDGITDGQGSRHAMAGLLPLETSFAAPRLHLGYRTAILVGDGPLGRAGNCYRGHEFHYSSAAGEDGAEPLFQLADARGQALGPAGLRRGSVMGSFTHLVDRWV